MRSRLVRGTRWIRPPDVPAPDRLLNTPQAAEWLGLSVSCLEKWRCIGEGPDFVRLGRKSVFYRRATLEAWVAAREGRPPSGRARAAASAAPSPIQEL
jgi:predicted DNA-binding transcriptional regulator AlpA